MWTVGDFKQYGNGIPLLMEVNNMLRGIKKLSFSWIVFLILGSGIFYSTYSMCCHISFNGNYYREFFRSLF